MTLRDRMLEIDKLLVEPHRVLNAAAMGKVLHDAEIHRAVADITRAREMVTNAAEEPPEN